MKQMQYCALVSNPQAGWPVRGHDVTPSSLQNRYFSYLTAKISDTYSALPPADFSTFEPVACWVAGVRISIKQAVCLADWLAVLTFANCVASC